MRSIIDNLKEIEEENLKEVISLTNENDRLKRRIAAFEKDVIHTNIAIKRSYEKGFFDAITKVKDVIDQLRPQCGQSIAHECDPLENDDTNTCRK